MYSRLRGREYEPLRTTPYGKPWAVIWDRDGTYASCFARPDDKSNASWAAFNAALPFDAVVPWVHALAQSMRPGITNIMTSGRAEGDHPGDRRRLFIMQGWLAKVEAPIDFLFMRSGGDTRRDSIVKAEIYHEHIEPFFEVKYVVDDRPQVIDGWRELGLRVLAVTDPEIPPTIGANWSSDA